MDQKGKTKVGQEENKPKREEKSLLTCDLPAQQSNSKKREDKNKREGHIKSSCISFNGGEIVQSILKPLILLKTEMVPYV